jgi:hypothetical protein
MIAPISPVGSPSSSGNTPDAMAVAKSFEADLISFIALCHNLKPDTLETQLHNIAQQITAVHADAQKALIAGQG